MRGIYSPSGYNSLNEVWGELRAAPFISVDTETVSDKDLHVLVVGFCWKPNHYGFITVDDDRFEEFIKLIRPKNIIFHNTLFDENVFIDNFGYMPNVIADTMMMAQNLGYPGALYELSFEFGFPYTPVITLISNELGHKIPRKTLLDADREKLGQYCAEHAHGTLIVYHKLEDEVPPTYYLDFSLLPLLRSMTKRGMRVDKEEVERLHEQYYPIIEERRKLCESMGFNPESGEQISQQLQETGFFTGLTKKNKMKTDKHTLENIRHDSIVADSVLRYKEFSGQYATFIKPRRGIDRIYPKWRIVRTGRFAGSDPNPQNIPKFLRSPYIPEHGCMFWDTDAHQIEPTLQAYMSGDPKMIQAVSTGDVYTPIAERFYIKRKVAKVMMLALSYGASAETLAEGAGISKEDAAGLLSAVLTEFNVFARWRTEQMRLAEENGYVETLWGKRRSDMPPKDAVNSIIQGSAAVVLKLAMARLQNYPITTTVHDEILISYPTPPPSEALEDLIEIPISWEWKMGTNWLNVK
jgi:DNA polymerase-1